MERRVPRQRRGGYRRSGDSDLFWFLAAVLAATMAIGFWTVVIVLAVRGLPGWDW